MKRTESEEALELPDREAMSLLSTTPVMGEPLPSGGEQGLPVEPATASSGAQETAAGHTADATDLVQTDASATEQGSTTTEDRSDSFTSSDSASAES